MLNLILAVGLRCDQIATCAKGVVLFRVYSVFRLNGSGGCLTRDREIGEATAVWPRYDIRGYMGRWIDLFRRESERMEEAGG